jgi:hypothetical protein
MYGTARAGMAVDEPPERLKMLHQARLIVESG